MNKPPKKVLNALEKVFAAEIEGRLPFQSKAKIYKDLEAEGLLEAVRHEIRFGPFVGEALGYELTHAGRYLYCSHCGGDDDH